MCDHCGWEQALVDVRMMLGQDPHILDVARLERIRAFVERRQCVTPGQRREILTLEAEWNPDDEA
jgi:hypothetical protein